MRGMIMASLPVLYNILEYFYAESCFAKTLTWEMRIIHFGIDTAILILYIRTRGIMQMK